MTKFLLLPNGILENRLLGSRAKILYAHLISRRRLSLANGYVDVNGEPYAFCSPESAAAMLNCSRKTAQTALKDLAETQLIRACGKNQFYIKNIGGSFVMIPQAALELGCDCAVLYGSVASRIIRSLKSFCAYKNIEIQSLLSCGNKKACELLSKLEREKLINVRRTCKGNFLSLCGEMAKMTLRIISDKLEKIAAKKSEKRNSPAADHHVKKENAKCEKRRGRSVIFATKLDKVKLNNFSYISSSDDNEEYYEMTAQKLSLTNYESRYKRYIEAIQSIAGEAADTKRKNMWHAGRLLSKRKVISKIASLSVAEIAEICENVSKRRNIRCLKSYLLACIMNANGSAQKTADVDEHSYDLEAFERLAIGAPVDCADSTNDMNADGSAQKAADVYQHSYDLEAFEKSAIGTLSIVQIAQIRQLGQG